MKIALYADVGPQSGSGGSQVYLGALIRALGQLTDGPEEYLLLGPQGDSDWIEELRGPNQTIVPVARDSPGVASRLLQGWRNRLGSKPDVTPPSQEKPLAFKCRAPRSRSNLRNIVPLSSGKIESLGVSAIHFPFQEFILSSVPSIFNPHDLAHLHFPQFFSPDNIMRREVLYRFACQVSQRVAVASEWVARDISLNYNIAPSKIAVIPWGAATSGEPIPTSEEIARLRSEYQLPRQFVFYPAVAWPHKNHATLLAALALLSNQGNQTSLVCSGARTDLTSELERKAEDLGVRERVRFLGAVPQRDMRGLYRAALGVVVPTLFEALSGPMAEAWQEGIPVACSDIPQLREQGADAVLFFQPLSSASIAETLHILTSDLTKRQQLVARGFQKIAEMDWAKAARQYRELYRDVAKQTRPGATLSGEFV